jgi:hypothetical protein
MPDDKLETGCLLSVFAIWGIALVITAAFWIVVIWAIISVVSGLDDANCFNELGAAVTCP